MIFVDSNIPMYLVGAAHPHKTGARQLLQECIDQSTRLVTDAEVFQEILHRYVAIDRRDAIQPAFDALQQVVDEIYDVTLADALRAKEIVLGNTRLSARDAIHLAVMSRNRVGRILSFDRGFDGVPGVSRLS